MKKTKSIRLEESLIAAITKLAEKDRRTFSNQTECLLEDALSRRKAKLTSYALNKFMDKLAEEESGGYVTELTDEETSGDIVVAKLGD